MKGWVTWVVAGLAAAYGVGGFVVGLHSQDKMIEMLLYAGGLVGFGRKLDRVGDAVPKATGE